MTQADCFAAARHHTQSLVASRKLVRVLNQIKEKERYAALYKSSFMCKRYDEEIEALYDQVAELEGYSMANALELEPVSYTHLDVYKRQGLPRSSGDRLLDGNRRGLRGSGCGRYCCAVLLNRGGLARNRRGLDNCRYCFLGGWKARWG